MKKLMVAAAIVCAAAMSQAASFAWTSTAIAYAVAADSVVDNGNYTAASSGTNNRMSKGVYTYVLTLYTAGTETVIGTASGDVEFGSNKFNVTAEIAAAAASTTYDYKIAITGTQPSITGKTSSEYDYSGATLATTLSGSVTTAPFSDTDLTTGVPSTWAISGITTVGPEPTPEPTSAMLMLLGMAGLALKRKRA